MYKSRLVIISLLVALFAFSALLPAAPLAAQEYGPKTETIVVKAVPQDLAMMALKTGEIDAYLFPVPPEMYIANAENPNINFLQAPAGINDFILNPAPYDDPDKLNPFISRKIRFAVNYLVDRTYIVQQVFKGLAYPMYTFVCPADPDYLVLADLIAKYKTPYNPALAEQIITEEMLKMGAEKGPDGKWYYHGNPVTINFIIRIEDERKVMGDLLASALEQVGFTVNRLYMTFGEAIDIVYYTDPKEHQWDIYTEGWGKTGIIKYDDTNPAFWGAPWYGNMPGWGEPTWWNYENETIDEISKIIYFANFSSMKERNELYRECTEMIIKEAVRIMVVTTLDAFPLSVDVQGTTEDLGAGLRSLYNLRELYVPGRDTLHVGHLHVYTARTVWGPIDAYGFAFYDVYSVDPWSAVHDPWIWIHPFTGLYIPFRASFTVETAGPNGTLEVPEDAFMWNWTTDEWVKVGPGVTAKSKVTFDLSKLLGTNWHHGQPITWADVLHDIYLYYEWTFDEEKQSLDPLWNYFFADSLSKIKGFRIVGDTELEAYVDYWHFEPSMIAARAAPPVTNMPWEISHAIEQLVLEGKYAWNRFMSRAYGVPQINLIFPDHAADVAAKLQELGTSFPESVFNLFGNTLVTSEEVAARYEAVVEWVDETGNAVISNGPFYLANFDVEGDSLVLKAFRDPTYPFAAGDWVFGEAAKPRIISIATPVLQQGVEGAVFVDVIGPAPLGLMFTIRDPTTAEILMQGKAEAVSAYKFKIEIPAEFTQKVGPGLYEIEVLLYSEAVAAIDAKTAYINVLGAGPIAEEVEDLRSELGQLSSQLSGISSALADAIDSLSETLTSTLESMSGTLGGAVDAVSSKVESVSSDVGSLKSDVEDLSDAVTGLKSTVAQLNTTVLAVAVILVIDLIISIYAVAKK